MTTSTPQEDAQRIFDRSHEALMAHTIRGVINDFYKHGVLLEVQIIRDQFGLVYRKCPNKASFLSTRYYPPVQGDPYSRVKATISIRKDANHHLARLCIAHELYHAVLALKTFIEGNRKKWDGAWKPADEPLCNQFAQSLCKLHNGFNEKDNLRKERVMFPDEIFAKGFTLDLGNITALPDCLKIKSPDK